MALIDSKLLGCNLKRNTNYTYIIGDCLFDSIVYLLHYAISSRSLQFNSMRHFFHCLNINSPKARQTREQELNAKWLHDLYRGITNEYRYLQNLAITIAHDGLWRDFTAIKWNSRYLQKPTYIWHNDRARL